MYFFDWVRIQTRHIWFLLKVISIASCFTYSSESVFWLNKTSDRILLLLLLIAHVTSDWYWYVMHFWNEIRRSNEKIERICFKTHMNTNTLYRNVIEDIESAQCVAGVAFMWHWNKSTCNRWSNKQISSKAKSQKMTINFRKRKWTTERHIKSDKPNAKLNICKSKQINIHRQQIQAARALLSNIR